MQKIDLAQNPPPPNAEFSSFFLFFLLCIPPLGPGQVKWGQMNFKLDVVEEEEEILILVLLKGKIVSIKNIMFSFGYYNTWAQAQQALL